MYWIPVRSGLWSAAVWAVCLGFHGVNVWRGRGGFLNKSIWLFWRSLLRETGVFLCGAEGCAADSREAYAGRNGAEWIQCVCWRCWEQTWTETSAPVTSQRSRGGGEQFLYPQWRKIDQNEVQEENGLSLGAVYCFVSGFSLMPSTCFQGHLWTKQAMGGAWVWKEGHTSSWYQTFQWASKDGHRQGVVCRSNIPIYFFYNLGFVVWDN